MWKHTVSQHNSIISNPMTDYKYVLLNNFKQNLTRLCNERWRQTKLEELQRDGKVKVQNSKIDFTKPFMTNLNIQRGSGNNQPGIRGVGCRQQPHRGQQKPHRPHPAQLRPASDSFRSRAEHQTHRAKKFRAKKFVHKKKGKPTQTDFEDRNSSDNNRQDSNSLNNTRQTDSSLDSDKAVIAQPSKAKHRASTPIMEQSSKKIRFNIDLSPIKESQLSL